MRAWRLLLLGVRNSGAAFIKWGQWSATREDLFPQAGAHLLKLCKFCLSSGALCMSLPKYRFPNTKSDIFQPISPQHQAVMPILCVQLTNIWCAGPVCGAGGAA